MSLPGRVVSSVLSTPEREVVLIESVECSEGDRFLLTFESVDPRWRQGVWLAVEGILTVGDATTSQVVLWRDTAPDQVQLEVTSTGDGLLRLYDVWDSGRGLGPWESQSHASGLIAEAVEGGSDTTAVTSTQIRAFDSVVFTLRRKGRVD